MLRPMKTAAAMAVALGLWACAPYYHKHEPELTLSKLTDTTTYLKGQPVGQLVGDPEAAVKIAELVFGDDKIDKDTALARLKELQAKLDKRDDVGELSEIPEPLRGFGSLFGRAVVNAPFGIKTKWSGITADLLRNTSGGGHLSVDVIEEIFRPNGTTEKNIWHLDIEVQDKGFKVHPIAVDPGEIDPADPNSDPFPDVDLDLPKETLEKIKRLGLDRKLHVVAEKMTIRAVYKNGDFLDPRSHPSFYDSVDNCIDLLSKGFSPKNHIELHELDGFRCMGRCGGRVPIINTP